MNLRILISILMMAPLASTASAQGKARKPNVILIMTDDQGHGDLGFHGNPDHQTPNLDKLAQQSVRMKQLSRLRRSARRRAPAC